MKALNIIETAYRATLEEQDDTALWITHAMKGAGAELGVLLRGNAVNYGVRGQRADGLTFGDTPQTQPPDLENEVQKLIDKGIEVHVVEEDVAERGLERSDLIPGLRPVSRNRIGALLERYDAVWQW